MDMEVARAKLAEAELLLSKRPIAGESIQQAQQRLIRAEWAMAEVRLMIMKDLV